MIVLDAMNNSRLDADYVEKLREGGVDALHVSLIWANRGLCEMLQNLDDLHVTLGSLRHSVALVQSVADITRAKANNQIGLILGIQNTTPIGDREALVGSLHRLGIRIVQLTYNERNLVGDGCTERRDAGLSDFGIRVLQQLNAFRIAVDVAHAGEQTLLDAVENSTAPVICTHANARTLCDSPRNLSDRAIRAIASTGGVIGVNSFGPFVKKSEPDLEAILDHIDHIATLVGVEHVGIGTDLVEGKGEASIDGRTYKPSAYGDSPWSRALGLRSIVELPHLIAGLRRRGYDAREVAGIAGGNFLRVLESIWGG